VGLFHGRDGNADRDPGGRAALPGAVCTWPAEGLAEEPPEALGVEEADALVGEAGAALETAQSEVAALPFQVTVTSAAFPTGRRRSRSVCPTGHVTESHTC